MKISKDEVASIVTIIYMLFIFSLFVKMDNVNDDDVVAAFQPEVFQPVRAYDTTITGHIGLTFNLGVNDHEF